VLTVAQQIQAARGIDVLAGIIKRARAAVRISKAARGVPRAFKER
jgi:hypothetical protein